MRVQPEKVRKSTSSLRWLVVACLTLFVVAGCSDSTDPPPAATTYKSVTGADYHTCDLDNTGTAWCWGEVGDNTGTTLQLVPQKVNTTVRFAQLSASGEHTCGLTANGDAYCWGPNTDGHLGIGTFDAGTDVPAAVTGGIKFKSISAGSAHTCGVSTAGVGYCWGDNVHGQSGHSTTSDVAVPTQVQGGYTWASISAGTVNSCGITTAGAAYCWGTDSNGQIGDGGTISGSSLDTTAMPLAVSGGHAWKQISVGQFHVCGLTTAGAAYCWGFNDYRLGNNDASGTSQSAPVAVVDGHVFKSIDAGRYTTCAITTEDKAYCWGANLAGQYGVESPGDLSRRPVLSAGGVDVAEINTSSLEHTCAIPIDRKSVICFGRNDYAQLGNGGTVASTVHNWEPTVVSGQQP